MNHEKEHPQPTLRKLDGTPVGEDHRPEPIGPAGQPPRPHAPASRPE
jgi:hypothetical protein